MKRRLEKTKRGLIRLHQYICASSLEIRKKSSDHPKKILFTLDDDRLYREDDSCGRYAYLLLRAYNEAGYKIYFYRKADFIGFIRLRTYGQMIYTLKNLKFINHIPRNTQDFIYAFDGVRSEFLEKKWKKLVFVNILKPTFCCFGEKIWVPYSMHPTIYNQGHNNRIYFLRDSKRKLKIFFGGNTLCNAYSNSELREHYQQMTRAEGVDIVIKFTPYVKVIKNKAEFQSKLKGSAYNNEFWLLGDERFCTYEWLDTVSQCNFFMCFSGTDLPMCHNVIESMSVGTIPILSYADWFFPSLEHKKNAIIYSGAVDLISKIKEVLAMNQETMDEMRRNVMDYYDQYLSQENLIRIFESNKEDVCTLMLHPRLVSKPKEEELGRQLVQKFKKISYNAASAVNATAAVIAK